MTRKQFIILAAFLGKPFSRPHGMVYERMLAFGGLTCLILLANGKGV